MLCIIFTCSGVCNWSGIPSGAKLTVPNDPNPHGPFNLEIQEAINKYQPKAAEHLNKLKDILGVEFRFYVDFVTLHKHLPKSIFKKKMGEIILDQYLGALVNSIVDFLQKYPEKKMLFLLKTTKKNIIFNALKVKANKPMEVLFEDGNICINLEPSEFGFLTEKTGNNLDALLL
jgi:hypothetical protein